MMRLIASVPSNPAKMARIVCFCYISIVGILSFLRQNDLVGKNDPEEFCSSAFHIYNIRIIRSVVLARFAPKNLIVGSLEIALLYIFTSTLISAFNMKRTLKVFGVTYILTLIGLLGLAGFFSLYAGYNLPQFYLASTLNDCAHGLTPLLWLLLPCYLSLSSPKAPLGSPAATALLLVLLVVDYQQFWLSTISFIFGWISCQFLPQEPQQQLPTSTKDRDVSGKHRSTVSASPSLREHFLVLFLLIFIGVSSRIVTDTYLDECRTDPLAVLGEDLWEGDAFLDIVIPTVPRPTGATFLIEVLGTYVQTLPLMPVDPLWGRIRVHVINMNQDSTLLHTVFDTAKQLFGGMNASLFFHNRVDEFFSTPYVPRNFPKSVHFHIHPDWAASIWKGIQLGGRYIMLADDDYEICPKGWRNIMTTMCIAKKRNRGPCGFWFGFGSHMTFPRETAEKMVKVLVKDITEKHAKDYLGTDEVLSQCLEGHHPDCTECSADGAMMAPTKLLFRHIGFWSARVKDDQRNLLGTNDCSWRNPTNFPLHNALMVQVDH